MRKIIFLFFLLLSITALSQSIEINKAIAPYPNNPQTNCFATSISAFGNDYIIGTVGYDTINNNKQSVVFYKLDTLGNLTKLINFTGNSYNYYSYYCSLYQMQDSGYCCIINRDTNFYPENIIVRLNSNFDTLWTKVLSQETQEEILVQILETSDKSLVCVGYKEMSSISRNVLIIKTDSIGNMLWKKNITLGKKSRGIQLAKTPDKGFLISGVRSSSAFADVDLFVMKLDSVGNVKWYRILGNNNIEQGVASAVTPQGDYVVAYGYSTYTSPSEDYTFGRINVIKYNPDGITIWDKMYDTIRGNNSVSSIRILPNNNIVVIGFNYVENGIGNNNYYHHSFILSLNNNGDSLGYKHFTNMNSIADQNIIYDNVLNADGSITAIGKVQSWNLVPMQQIWLVKTGNVLTTDVMENYIPQGNISVYPNPSADDYITLSYDFDAINKNKQLFICDGGGRLVYQSKLNANIGQEKINIKDFANGSYICSFYSNNKLLNTVKFIKK